LHIVAHQLFSPNRTNLELPPSNQSNFRRSCTPQSLPRMLKDQLVGPLGMMPEALQAREKYDYPLHSTVPATPTFPPFPSSINPPSYRISLSWDVDNENMVHVTQAPKARLSWFRRMSDGPSQQQHDAKLGLRTFHDPPGGADLE
jgi:hypothetical protein